jgi:Zn-dependent protease
LGHILAALALGMRVHRVGIAWRGAYVLISGGSDMANMLVCAAGPVTNILLFFLAAFTGHGLFAAINLVFASFQLIPLFGSDGHNILKFIRAGLAIPANEEA